MSAGDVIRVQAAGHGNGLTDWCGSEYTRQNVWIKNFFEKGKILYEADKQHQGYSFKCIAYSKKKNWYSKSIYRQVHKKGLVKLRDFCFELWWLMVNEVTLFIDRVGAPITLMAEPVSSTSRLSLLFCYAAFRSQVRIPLGEQMFAHFFNETCKWNQWLVGITKLVNLLLNVWYRRSKMKIMERILFGPSRNNLTLKNIIRLKVNITGTTNYRNQKTQTQRAVTKLKN